MKSTDKLFFVSVDVFPTIWVVNNDLEKMSHIHKNNCRLEPWLLNHIK